jgi:protein phosphatase
MSNWIGIGHSETGLVRTMNQDAFLVLDHVRLWAVADGMGGHVGGEIAAQLAIATIQVQVESSRDSLHTGQRAPTDLLKQWILAAHEAILHRASSEQKLRGMGTTIVLAAIILVPTPTMYIAHVGDSRAYRFRSGTLTSLTKDHTLIEQYLSRGILTAESAKTHPERHVLTRALGMQSQLKPTLSAFPLQPDDCFVLCSDGLTKMLEDEQIESIMTETIGDPTHSCDRLIKASLEHGGEDNVTVVVVAHR